MKNLKDCFVVLVLLVFITQSCSNANSAAIKMEQLDTAYVCMPCGRSCDTTLYEKPGSCSSCMMPLVNKATVNIKTISPAAVCNFITGMGNNNVLLLDVRTAEEFNGSATDKFGRLAGAVNIPVQELEKRLAELSQYKNKEIIVYCSHSRRSPMATYLLMQNGFTKVTNMQYGMSEWQNKVKPDSCNSKLYVKH